MYAYGILFLTLFFRTWLYNLFMKKLFLFIIIIFFLPFVIVYYSNNYVVKEIKLDYVNSLSVRVKRVGLGRIDNISLEEYIVGVLAGEMPIYFEPEALKAQAVAARSYVLKRMEYNKDNEFDVVDSIMNQVYLDRDYLKEAWGGDYVKNINKLVSCVNDTLGEYLEYNGEVVDALFFSTSNGYTENADVVFSFSLPYLKSVESVWDSKVSTAFKNSISISLVNFYEKLGISYSDSFNVSDVVKSSSGRVISLKINDVSFKAMDVYNKLGLRSLDFNFERVGSNVIINTSGYGHGVGMSQYGALGMALEGYNYKDILFHYYTGVSIKKI